MSNHAEAITKRAADLRYGDVLASGHTVRGITVQSRGPVTVLTDGPVFSFPYGTDAALLPDCYCGEDTCPWC